MLRTPVIIINEYPPDGFFGSLFFYQQGWYDPSFQNLNGKPAGKGGSRTIFSAKMFKPGYWNGCCKI